MLVAIRLLLLLLGLHASPLLVPRSALRSSVGLVLELLRRQTVHLEHAADIEEPRSRGRPGGHVGVGELVLIRALQ